MMKKLLLSTLMLFVSICGFAYDCEVDGIYYDLNTTDYTACVTYKIKYLSNYSGVVHIPAEVEYNGTTYSVTSIGDDAFESCSELVELTIPNSVTSIGMRAFYGCSGLTELTIPNSVTFIGDWVFESCSGLEKIVVDSGNLYYDSREDCNAVIRKDENVLVAGCKNTHIPNSVTSIGDWAFRNCISLTELTIPNSVTSIGNAAFAYCFGLTELTISNSVTSIGDWAFEGCSGLTSITSLNTTPPHIGGEYNSSAFDSTTEQNVPLHVPAGCKEAYQQAEYWSNFVNIQDDASTDIKSVNADKQDTNSIYTLDGVKLNTSNLSDLPAGIYIANGKKVVVK